MDNKTKPTTTGDAPSSMHAQKQSAASAKVPNSIIGVQGTPCLSHGNSMTQQDTTTNNNEVLKKSTSSAPDQIEIKLFVGRLPSTSTENSIRQLFLEFGDVVDVVIFRDKASSEHKGSAFVRMASITSADAAIRAMHNTRVVDQTIGPLQISYATGEAERLGFTPGSLSPGEDEAKIFVGSLPRDVTELEVEKFFLNFGKAYDAYLMKDPTTKRFKGCGFIKFALKEEALVAIKQLHGKVTFPGASRALEVRIAEPKRPAGSTSAVLKQNQSSGAQQAEWGFRQQNVSESFGGQQRFGQQQQQQQQQVQQPSNANPRSAGPWKEYFTTDGRPYYHNDQLGLTQWEVPSEFLQTYPAREGGDVTGPLGANIFVFHVPNEWGKEDLASHFSSFGHILSAKVAVDYTTNRNKGYGFVSYDNVRSALQAVQQMNLTAVGNKRLRVAIKNGEEEAASLYAEQNGVYQSYSSSNETQSNTTTTAPVINLSNYPQPLGRSGMEGLSQVPPLARSFGDHDNVNGMAGSGTRNVPNRQRFRGATNLLPLETSLGGTTTGGTFAGANAFLGGYNNSDPNGFSHQRYG